MHGGALLAAPLFKKIILYILNFEILPFAPIKI